MSDSSTRTIPVQQQAALLPEDQSRADLYALLARLLYAGPDERVLQLIRGAGGSIETASRAERGDARRDAESAEREGGEAALGSAWRTLVAAAGSADAAGEVAIFDQILVGTGKAKVTPYLTHYLVQQGRERVLVTLREELAVLGLGRRGGVHEPEDHIAGLCEVMRHLVSQGSSDASLRAQRAFFERFVRGGYEGLCNALDAEPALSPFYRAVCVLVREFFRIEARGFELLD